MKDLPRKAGAHTHAQTVGPLELFYDLAVVVLAAQAAHHLAGDLTWPGLGQFAVVFTLVWIAWANGSLHHELHGHEDARACAAVAVVCLGVGAVRPAPLVPGLALVLLLSIPWVLAVARRLAGDDEPAAREDGPAAREEAADSAG